MRKPRLILFSRARSASGFTLLEVIIVIIIVGVLASLALPRLMKMIELTRAQEAISAIAAIRGGMERCYLFRATYSGCDIDTIDTGDPLKGVPGAHWTFSCGADCGIDKQSAEGYRIGALRTTVAGGDNKNSAIYFEIDSSGSKLWGHGLFNAIGNQ